MSTMISSYMSRFSQGNRGSGTGGTHVVVAVNTNFEGEFSTTWAQTIDGDVASGPVQTTTPVVDSSYVEYVFDQAFICDAIMAAGGDNNIFGKWNVYGSNDGTTYDLLGLVTWTNVANGALKFASQNKITNGCEMAFTNTTGYNRYKMVYHSNFGAAGRYCFEMLFRRNQNQLSGKETSRTSLLTASVGGLTDDNARAFSNCFDADFFPYHDTAATNFYSSISTSSFFQIQFPEAVIMHDTLILSSMNGDATVFGTWKWQRSNNGTSWTDEGSPFLFNGDVAVHSIGLMLPDPGGTTAATYWRLQCTDATKNHNVFMSEWLFNLDGDQSPPPPPTATPQPIIIIAH